MMAALAKQHMTPDPDTTLVLSRNFAAERDLVFDVLLDAKALQTIWSVDAWTVVDITVDPRVGGGWKLAMREDATGRVSRCTARYVEIEKPSRIVWRSKWLDGPLAGPAETRITLELSTIADGTRLTLVHELLPDGETRDRLGQRWASELKQLGRLLAGELR